VHRYLKNVFPKVDETILLDILEQSDNNVQKASEKLIGLGYEKRNPTLPAKALAKKKEEEQVRLNYRYLCDAILLTREMTFIFADPK